MSICQTSPPTSYFDHHLVDCFTSPVAGKIQLTFFLIIFWTTASFIALADGEPPVTLKTLGQKVVVQLHDLTEGIGAAFTIKVVNRLEDDFDLMIAKNSCSCLQVEGVEGNRFDSSETVEIIAKVRPTANQFSQKCSITGRNKVGERVEICTFVFEAKVRPPIVISTTTVKQQEAFGKKVPIQVQPSREGVSILFGKIECSEPWLKVESDSPTSLLLIEVLDESEIDRVAEINIPFTLNNRGYNYRRIFSFVNQTGCSFTPSRPEWRVKKEVYCCRVIGRSKSTDPIPDISRARIVLRTIVNDDTRVEEVCPIESSFKRIKGKQLPTQVMFAEETSRVGV